ncbi:nucleoside-diphosphate-sugar epimerase [Chryseobacterium sp. 52]|uniref:SDR family oxidoreductase n=1 Tax=Chryseobacterium sp. 52 TaxID=2035213 RepID=UPI000C17D2B2|nr:aldehyde reductase [Chryseobacterium sp. 52]PIF46641.1 nucleoside-diphosphate-sugar epimerase [Chryseobacterium sp. 52]
MNTENNNELVLVTGGSGFVALHAIQQLLEKGYHVRATVRSLNRKDEVIAALKNGGVTGYENVEFAETDLSSDSGWKEAMKNVTYVLHIASPIFLHLPKHEDEMIRPAVDGTLRVLTAARDAGVKRVVMTSNFGAVGYSHKDPTQLITEESWTDPNEKGLSAYNKSKVYAERAAWDFIKREGGNLELTVINPTAIFGPSFSAKLSSGFELLKNMLDGSMKAIPNIELAIVDVRDLADLHIRAMESPDAKGQRFLALSGGTMTLPQIAKFLKEKIPEASQNISTKTLADWQVRIAALFDKRAKAIVPLIGVNRKASNEKAKRLLGWQPRTNEQAIIATVESLLKYNQI